MNDLMTRRRFFQALAASALAAGVPLPVGFPREVGGYSWTYSRAEPGCLEFHFITRYINTGLMVESGLMVELKPAHTWE